MGVMTVAHGGASGTGSGDWKPVATAASFARVSPQTVYNYIKRHEIQSKNTGGRTLVRMEDVRRMAAQRHARFPVPAIDSPQYQADEPASAGAETAAEEESIVQAADRLAQLADQQITDRSAAMTARRAELEARITELQYERDAIDLQLMELDEQRAAIETVRKIAAGGDA